ncbi:MAG: hypothetical protein CK424_08615 [Legionella sp.]|nr:MAG: hypothetical protein CK424_08615 [Legionella sp.]
MSQESMQIELTLALECREGLLKELSNHPKIHPLIEKELIHILYANNSELLEIAQRNIDFLISPYLDPTNPTHQAIQKMLQAFIDQRAGYLKAPPKTFFAYWSQHQRTNVDLFLLTVPLLVGLVFPPVGIITLVYAGIDAGLASLDFRQAHYEYWDEEERPDSRELSEEQTRTLQQTYPNIDIFLPEQNIDSNLLIDKKINTASYAIYGIMLVISLIALAALVFPPVGIPAVALTALLFVNIGGIGLQFGFTFQKQHTQLNNIQNALTGSEQLTHVHQHEHASTLMITERLSTPKKTHPRKRVKSPPAVQQPTPSLTPMSIKPAAPKPQTHKKRKTDDQSEGEAGPHP